MFLHCSTNSRANILSRAQHFHHSKCPSDKSRYLSGRWKCPYRLHTYQLQHMFDNPEQDISCIGLFVRLKRTRWPHRIKCRLYDSSTAGTLRVSKDHIDWSRCWGRLLQYRLQEDGMPDSTGNIPHRIRSSRTEWPLQRHQMPCR